MAVNQLCNHFCCPAEQLQCTDHPRLVAEHRTSFLLRHGVEHGRVSGVIAPCHDEFVTYCLLSWGQSRFGSIIVRPCQHIVAEGHAALVGQPSDMFPLRLTDTERDGRITPFPFSSSTFGIFGLLCCFLFSIHKKGVKVIQ